MIKNPVGQKEKSRRKKWDKAEKPGVHDHRNKVSMFCYPLFGFYFISSFIKRF